MAVDLGCVYLGFHVRDASLTVTAGGTRDVFVLVAQPGRSFSGVGYTRFDCNQCCYLVAGWDSASLNPLLLWYPANAICVDACLGG